MNKSGTILCLLSIPHWENGKENWKFEIPVNTEDKIVLSKCRDNSMSRTYYIYNQIYVIRHWSMLYCME